MTKKELIQLLEKEVGIEELKEICKENYGTVQYKKKLIKAQLISLAEELDIDLDDNKKVKSKKQKKSKNENKFLIDVYWLNKKETIDLNSYNDIDDVIGILGDKFGLSRFKLGALNSDNENGVTEFDTIDEIKENKPSELVVLLKAVGA